MDNAIAHKLRLKKKKQAHQDTRIDARQMVSQYLDRYLLPMFVSELSLLEHYQAINELLEAQFDTAHQYYLARQGFLEAVRAFNKIYNINLDEPVIPILQERDTLTIGYNWFVQGMQVADSTNTMISTWQNKRKFTANDLIEGALYCSIVYGGLNDIAGLEAFYQWLLNDYSLKYISFPCGLTSTNIEYVKSQMMAVIPLTLKDANYGCQSFESSTSDRLERYLNYVPDDMTLCFIYALANKTVSKNNIKTFNTLIKGLSKKLKLDHKDIEKPHLSQLFKYANYNWRQTEGCNIDNALSVMMQGQVKTTALPTLKLLSYNQEIIRSNHLPLTWTDLFLSDYSANSSNDMGRAETKIYPHFSKNLITAIQSALKGTRAEVVNQINELLNEFSQPNAQRLLGWTIHLLADKSKQLNTVSKYIGCIGRDWLMLSMSEQIKNWTDEDFESIYEQIIQSKVKDGRKVSVLKKDSEFIENLADIKNSTVDIQTDTDTLNAFEKFKNTQKFTYGRLRDFHEYQRTNFNAPYVYFPYGNNRQVVKANIVSPRIYRAMQDDIYTSHLDTEQKRLCLVVLSLAYRTGMRIKELIGITLDDIADIYSDQTGQTIEAPIIWLKPNRHRSLKSSSAKRCIPIHCLLKPDELNCFIDLYYKQTRLKHRYLFSFGSGDHPLTDIFFSNLVKQLWDRTLDDHDLTFHSLRHTAISQLALVLKQSSLAQVMTDYDAKHCEAIRAGVLASNQNQGVWFGLASLVGHLTCDITFEYYIHTAHLLAGEQISRSRLGMPLVIFEAITGFGYQTVHRQDENAYDASSKQVRLYKVRNYLLKKLTSDDNELFTDNISENIKNVSSQLKDNQNIANTAMSEPSIYTHAKYADVIAFLKELQGIKPVNRISKLAEVALRHAINTNQAEQIYRRAEGVFKDDRLLLGSPKGKLNQDVLIKTQSRAYEMSITNSDDLKQFTQIFTSKQNLKTSSIHFGVKIEQTALLKQFMTVGCKLIDASHWQIRSDSEEAVTELKRQLKLDNRIRTGARKNYKGFEIRVVQKKTKHSENNLASSDDYLSSSGVLKYLGYMLMTLIEIE